MNGTQLFLRGGKHTHWEHIRISKARCFFKSSSFILQTQYGLAHQRLSTSNIHCIPTMFTICCLESPRTFLSLLACGHKTHLLNINPTQEVTDCGSDSKESACNAGDLGSIPGPHEDPLKEGMVTHSSILVWRLPVARGAYRATVHGVAKSETRLSD